MTIHSLTEYLKYRWYAKTRHGTHSPFVYDFIDNVLLDKALHKANSSGYIMYHSDAGGLSIKLDGVSQKYMILIASAISYYNNAKHLFPESPEFRFINANDALSLSGETTFSAEQVIIIINIHANSNATANWENCYINPAVSLSIDLYQIGLLFFKKEFKQKQHFILKY